jgi:cytochrome c-type biogenesis protein CcmH
MMTARRGLKVLFSVIPAPDRSRGQAPAGIQRSFNSLDSGSRSLSTRLAGMTAVASVAVFLLLTVNNPLHAAAAPDLEDQTRALAAELRCVVCQNLSVADSPSEMAQQMRAIVREQLQAGKTPEQVKDFFVSKYGEWVLLKPKTSGFGLLLWLLPYVALAAGVIIALWFIRRWTRRKAQAAPNPVPGDMERVRSEILRDDFERAESEDMSPRAELLREGARLRAELRELEFDFQSGKHSEADFMALTSEIENKAVLVMAKLDVLPPPAIASSRKEKKPIQEPARNTERNRRRLSGWQLAAGGSFLLLFGLALGIFLTQSLRPRMSEQDTITGDFMTGTSGAATAALLQEGKQAFAKQEFAKAIEAFKLVLAQEPNQPEAHSYMGFILVQAGHGDGALLAFEKALAVAPNFPMALWGKGMVLYQDKKDYPGARVVLEKLLQSMPPGEERNEVSKVLAEISASGAPSQKAAGAAPTAARPGQTISGKITIDAKLKDKIDTQAALFIIARPAGGAAGPPLAVKKIDKPTFPLSYSLGQENVMMQGTPFAGKINITVRLDKDGNAMTREAGNLLGDYKKNPAEVGSQNVDIILDQLAP